MRIGQKTAHNATEKSTREQNQIHQIAYKYVYLICLLFYFASNFRRLPNLLAALLLVQHNGRNVHKIGSGMSAGRDCIHINNVARLHEQLCESNYLYHI